jgi:ParB family chromosome partitioning protein
MFQSDKLAELAQSIRANGIIQPLVVRKSGDRFQLVAGERRWRAAKIAGITEVPIVVRDVPDERLLEITLIENIQREDLNAIEEATGLKRLIDEFHITQEEAARAVGRSRVAVTNLLRLLELSPAVQQMLQDGRIDMGHARALLALSRSRQVELAGRIASLGLSVRETERLVQQAQAQPKASAKAGRAKLDADTRRLQEELSESLGATVHVKPKRGGRGSLVIDYSSLDQLQGIVGKIRRR